MLHALPSPSPDGRALFFTRAAALIRPRQPSRSVQPERAAECTCATACSS